MSISAQFLPQKISIHFQFHLLNLNFILKEGSRTKGHKAALIKEQCWLDTRKYSFSQRVINE